MYGVLSFLRTIICSGIAFVIWYIAAQSLPQGTLIGVLLPVWLGGMVGGLISALFNPHQGMMLAFTCGILLMIGFLWFRHGMAGLGLGANPFLTLWPVWFPPAFYVGAYGYLLFLSRKGSS